MDLLPRLGRHGRLLGAMGALLFAATAARGDVFFLRNGDRITGTVVAETPRAFTVQTGFGRITLPKSGVERVQRANGREEVLVGPAAVEPSLSILPAEPTGAKTRLGLIISGNSFWQAWKPEDALADPTLRFEVRLDGAPVASYTDAKLDEGDIPGAVVNSFAFVPGEVAVQAGNGVRAVPPETRPGRIVLRMDVPTSGRGPRELSLAYQINEGTKVEPAWKDLVTASAEIVLPPAGFTFLQVRQDRGRMQFSGLFHKRMKNVGSFQIDIIGDDHPPASP